MTTLVNGQKLWWVPRRIRSSDIDKEVTVVKVGRKWAQLDNGHRIDIRTLVADGGEYTAPGHCFFSREIYQSKCDVSIAWTRLKVDMQYENPGEAVSAEDIAAARKLLGL